LKAGEYSARRLRSFTPREGTTLAKEQRELEERIDREKADRAEEVRATETELQDVDSEVVGEMDEVGDSEDALEGVNESLRDDADVARRRGADGIGR
jgi:hypothetical protein